MGNDQETHDASSITESTEAVAVVGALVENCGPKKSVAFLDQGVEEVIHIDVDLRNELRISIPKLPLDDEEVDEMGQTRHRLTDTHESWPPKDMIHDLSVDPDPYRKLKNNFTVTEVAAVKESLRLNISEKDSEKDSEQDSRSTTPGTLSPVRKPDFEIVKFAANDPGNPRNWSKLYKWYCTMVAAFTFAVVAFNSSIITADMDDVAEEFGVSGLVALLTFSVFVLGFGAGSCSLIFQILVKIRTQVC